MKLITQFFRKRILLGVFLIFYFSVSFLTYKDYGLTMDEFFVYTRGQYFYTKVKGNDKHLQKGFVVRERKNENLLYYNSTYAALLYALNDDHSYENYHLLNLLAGSFIFILSYELLLLLYGKQYLAIIAPIFLLFTPRIFGHIPTNPKDIPFAIAYLASLFCIFAFRKKQSQISILILGILIGLTSSLRFIGFALLPIYALSILYEWFLNKKEPLMQVFWNMFWNSILMFIVAFCIFIMSMPYVAVDPFNHLLELIQVNKLYPWKGFSYFMGSYITETSRSWTYLPVWFLITTPVFILILFVSSFIIKKDKIKKSFFFLILISMLVHLVMYFVLSPVIYNGLRHYLFIVVHIVILAAFSFNELLLQKKFVKPLIGVVGINIIVIILFYFKFHPYEYTFFNSAIGGIQNASKYFETDYWGASDKAALSKLKTHLEENNVGQANVYTCSQSASLSTYLPQVISVNNDITKADYIVCIDSIANVNIQKNMNVTLLDTVTIDGVTFNYIYKVNR